MKHWVVGQWLEKDPQGWGGGGRKRWRSRKHPMWGQGGLGLCGIEQALLKKYLVQKRKDPACGPEASGPQ